MLSSACIRTSYRVGITSLAPVYRLSTVRRVTTVVHSKKNAHKDASSSSAKDVKHEVQDTVDKIQDSAQKVGDKAKDMAEDVAGKTKNAVREGSDKVKERAEHIINEGSDAKVTIAQKVDQAAAKAGDQARSSDKKDVEKEFTNAKQAVADAAKETKDAVTNQDAESASESVKKTGGNLLDQLGVTEAVTKIQAKVLLAAEKVESGFASAGDVLTNGGVPAHDAPDASDVKDQTSEVGEKAKNAATNAVNSASDSVKGKKSD